MQTAAIELYRYRYHNLGLCGGVVQAMFVRVYAAGRELLPLLQLAVQCKLWVIQLALCNDKFCPNYYLSLRTHEPSLKPLLLLALALLLMLTS